MQTAKRIRVDGCTLLAIPKCIRVAAIMRPFLALPDFHQLIRVCKLLQTEAGDERIRRLVPEWKAGEDPNAALQKTAAWFDHWRSSSQFVMTTVKSGLRRNRPIIRVCHPGTAIDFIFVTPAHRHVRPRALPYGNMGTRAHRRRLIHGIGYGQHDMVERLLATATNAYHRLDVHKDGPDSGLFVDVFPSMMARGIADFALDNTAVVDVFKRFKASIDTMWDFQSIQVVPATIPYMHERCRLNMVRGCPVVAGPKGLASHRPLRCRAQLVASVTRYTEGKVRLPDHLRDDPVAQHAYATGSEVIDFPVFDAATRQLLPRSERVICAGDTTADLFSIAVRIDENISNYKFKFRWRGSILFQRGESATPSLREMAAYDSDSDEDVVDGFTWDDL